MVVAPEGAGTAPAPMMTPAPVAGRPAGAAAHAPARSRTGLWITLGIAGVAIIVGAIIGLNFLVSGLTPEPIATDDDVVPQDVTSDAVPKVAELTGTRDGEQVTFTWTNPDPREGDSFIWSVVDVSGVVDPQQAPEPKAQFVPPAAGKVCIDVLLRRDDGRASEAVRGCVE